MKIIKEKCMEEDLELTKKTDVNLIIKEKGEVEKINFLTYTQQEFFELAENMTQWINKNVRIEDSVQSITEEFQIEARKHLISQRLDSVYIIRVEEILSTIVEIKKNLEEHEKKTDEEIKRMLNSDLMEINNKRGLIPILFVELESLAAAIHYNKSTTETSRRRLIEIKKFIKENFNDENFQKLISS